MPFRRSLANLKIARSLLVCALVLGIVAWLVLFAIRHMHAGMNP